MGVPVTFSHDGGNITGPINLEIFGDGNEDMITYTTDFTEPDENSNIYTGPIAIDETTIVRAKALKRTIYHFIRIPEITFSILIVSILLFI